jgi:hypothetical protein
MSTNNFPEVDYSLFIMMAAVMVLMEAEKQPGATAAAFPLLIFVELLRFIFFSVDSDIFPTPTIESYTYAFF